MSEYFPLPPGRCFFTILLPQAAVPPRYLHPKTTPNAIKSSTKSKPFSPHFGDRPWRQVTGPPIPEINLRIPLDPIAAAGIERGLKPFREYLNHTASLAQIQRHHPPVDVLGGYKFPNAPAIDLNPVQHTKILAVSTDTYSAIPATYSAIPADLSIPEFLRCTELGLPVLEAAA